MSDEWIIIAGMAAVTFIPRVAPLILLPGVRLPRRVEIWLSLIAPAVIAALLLPELTLDRAGDVPALAVPNERIFAAIPAFAVAILTKNMLLTVVAGVASAALLRLILQ
jgi:branched-subunit amino acid transport protein